jgi:ribose/xylose/arabinose/galactoside ABC-type transport system permease subunit
VGVKRWHQKPWFGYYLWAALALYAGLLAGWFWIPQQLPAAIIPLLSALVIRLLFRLIQSGQISFKPEFD